MSSLGFFIAFLINIIPSPKIKKAITAVLLFIIAFYFILEFYLFRAFGYFYPPETVLHMSSGVLGSFSGSVIKTFLSGIYALPIFLVPPLFFLYFPVTVKKSFSAILRSCALLLVLSAVLEISAISYVYSVPSLKDAYRDAYEFSNASKRFGLLCSTKLNFIYSRSVPDGKHEDFQSVLPSPQAAYNSFDVDFDELIAQETDEDIKNLHRYYSSVLPSEQNDYTGIFKGKNLIFICAEAFSPYCISQEKTPTLYKLSYNGVHLGR